MQKRQKVLLMGRSGSGKTSMRQVIFSTNYSPADTVRFGATLDVETSNIRLFGSLSLNIWDCGGQQSYMDNYLATSGRQNTFKDVAILIYVFDVKSAEWDADVKFFESVLDGLNEFSGSDEDGGRKPGVYVLINKMDLVDPNERARIEKEKTTDLLGRVKKLIGGRCRAFGTSIWDESLYKAWSLIIRTLIPNTQRLTTHLSRLRDRSSSTEVVLFERQTFLVIARSHPLPPRVVVNGVLKRRKNKPVEVNDDFGGRGGGGGGLDDGGRDDGEGWEESEMDVGHAKRFEKISEMIKSFRMVISSTLDGGQLQNWQADFRNCSLVIAQFTSNTFCLVVSNDLRARSDYLLQHLHIARPHFEELASGQIRIKCPICKVDPTLNYLIEEGDGEAPAATAAGGGGEKELARGVEEDLSIEA